MFLDNGTKTIMSVLGKITAEVTNKYAAIQDN